MIESSSLALYIHLHHANYREDLSFWLDLARQQGDPILEQGCGSGRVLIPLSKAGYRVYGLDKDRHSLALLKGFADHHASMSIVQADMTALPLGLLFSLVIMPCNTYTTLTKQERLSTLQEVYRCLRPGGLFAASLPNPTALEEAPPRAEPELEEVIRHPSDGSPIQVSSAWNRSGKVFTLAWYYDHLLPDGRVERHSAQTTHYLVPMQTYLEEFDRTGFNSIVMFGDFDHSPYSHESPYLIFVAAKKAKPTI